MTFANVFLPRTDTAIFIKQTLLDVKGELLCSATGEEVFNTSFSLNGRSFRQKSLTEKLEFNYTVEQMDLTDYLQNIPSNSCRTHILYIST